MTYHEWTRVNATTMARDVDGQRLTMKEKDKTFTVTTADGSLLASGKFAVAVKAAALNSFRKNQAKGRIAREVAHVPAMTATTLPHPCMNPASTIWPEGPAGETTVRPMKRRRPNNDPVVILNKEQPA
jgi:hypothetical protein